MTQTVTIFNASTKESVVRAMTPEEEAEHNAETIAAVSPERNPLSMTDLRLGIIQAGYSIAQVEANFQSIEDIPTRESVWVWWTTAQMVAWDNPQTQQLLVLAGFTQEQAHTMWVNRVEAMLAGA